MYDVTNIHWVALYIVFPHGLGLAWHESIYLDQ